MTTFVAQIADFDKEYLNLLNIKKIIELINISSIDNKILVEFFEYLGIKNNDNNNTIIINSIDINYKEKLPWQQYRHLIDKQFIYNRMWSKNKLFRENTNINILNQNIKIYKKLYNLYALINIFREERVNLMLNIIKNTMKFNYI